MKRNDYLTPHIKLMSADCEDDLAVSLPGFGDGGSLNAKKGIAGSVWDDDDASSGNSGADEPYDAPRNSFWE